MTALGNNIEQLGNKGIDEKYIHKLQNDNALFAAYDEEIDKLKVDFKTKALRAKIKMSEIKKQIQEAKSIVRLNIDKSRWREFGIYGNK